MKKLLTWSLALSMVLGLCAAPAIAAQKQKAAPEELFKRMDKNSDGKLSAEEFKGKREGEKADKAAAAFKKMDKDNDGFLTLDEFKAGASKKK
jgi:hypothetical protein